MLTRIAAHQKYPKFQCQLWFLFFRFLSIARVFVDNDAAVIATGHMLTLIYAVDELALDQYDRGIGCLSFGCHHHFFLVRGQWNTVANADASAAVI